MQDRGWPHLQATYDAVAGTYADRFDDELEGKPFDRALLDRVAAQLAGSGTVVDVGCGPGHVGAYLADRGCDVLAVDLSPQMLRVVRERHPQLRVQLGDVRALPLADASCAAVVAFYSLIHVLRAEAPAALTEACRVLRPGGLLVLAVHGGSGELHADDWLDSPVAVDVTLFDADEIVALAGQAGFDECRLTAREPYPTEHPTTRLYLEASRGYSGVTGR